MRLKSVYISQYKNLQEFTLNFDEDSFIDIFVGKNGSGKSNFFEAIIEIFRHIIEYDNNKAESAFDYSIVLSIDDKGTETKVEWSSGKLRINNRVRKTIGKTKLPDNVLIYYSGHNDTVFKLVEQYEESFEQRIKGASINESRFFIEIGTKYKELLLTTLLLQPEECKARKYICQKLNIQSISTTIKLVFDRPNYALKNSEFDIENNDESDRYWKAEGITKNFLDRLHKCIDISDGSPIRSEGYFSSNDQYILYFDIQKVRDEFTDFTPQELFRQLDNLLTLKMLTEVSVTLHHSDGREGSINHFSDGQFQSVYIYAIVELFKDKNCITLLDEPDSFLHPEWQHDFLKQVFDITDEAQESNHILLSSHSASTLCNLNAQQISLFKIENSTISCHKRSKKEIVQELSGNYITYSEDESKLLIDNAIRASTKPVMFVEGISDVTILNTAYEKLYPGEDIPILIQDAFDHGFIKTLFARNDIFEKYSSKKFFALFDFDKAYENWRSLGGDYEVDDIEIGLCRKLSDKEAYAFMLPIPNNQLRLQVWDENNPTEKIKPNPCFAIEHIFWESLSSSSDRWFKNDSKGIIKFRTKKNKVKFAEDIVPSLEPHWFEILRPMFDFIKLKCE